MKKFFFIFLLAVFCSVSWAFVVESSTITIDVENDFPFLLLGKKSDEILEMFGDPSDIMTEKNGYRYKYLYTERNIAVLLNRDWSVCSVILFPGAVFMGECLGEETMSVVKKIGPPDEIHPSSQVLLESPKKDTKTFHLLYSSGTFPFLVWNFETSIGVVRIRVEQEGKKLKEMIVEH